MSELLEEFGLFFDELNKIRVLDPRLSNKTNELKEECKLFVDKTDEFQRITDVFINLVTKLSTEVENQKIKAVGIRNLLELMSKQKDIQQEQYQALIIEKTAELERLKNRHNSLQKTEIEQQEIINNLSHY